MFLDGVCARILIASGATPHCPYVLPSAAYISRQSKLSTRFGSSWLIAAAVTAAINSSVTRVVQLIRGESNTRIELFPGWATAVLVISVPTAVLATE